MGMNTSIRLAAPDWEMVKTLTTVCAVKVLSGQVCLHFQKGKSSGFDIGTNEKHKCIFPANWSLQWVGTEIDKYGNASVLMTFEVLPIATAVKTEL